MADKRIQDLTPASSVQTSDRFVLEQSGQAKSLTGQILLNDLAVYLDGHGGIADISYTPPSSGSLTGTLTITLADETVETFSVTNGRGIASFAKTGTSGLVDTYTITYNDGSTPTTFTVTNGREITSVEKVDTTGLVDTYEISYNDGSEPTEFTITNGKGIESIGYVESVGLDDYYQIDYNDGEPTTFIVHNGEKGDTGDNWYVHIKWAAVMPTQDSDMVNIPSEFIGIYAGISATAPTDYTEYAWYDYKGEKGDTGTSISSVAWQSSSGLVDTYRVNFDDGTSTTFNVTNGSQIDSITKTSTVGLVDTYTVRLTNGNQTTFQVNNGKSIVSVAWTNTTSPTGVPHVPGATDTYTISYNDGDTSTFQIYNGLDGEGASITVDGIPSVNGNVPLLVIDTEHGAPTPQTQGSTKSRYFDAINSVLYICLGYDENNGYVWRGAGVTVDSALSTSSTNPVQNRVITNKIGTAALDTTAQDLSGAVNEILDDISGFADNLADEYDATATYAVGDLCIHDNVLYRCNTAISTPEAWNSIHWTATSVDTELDTISNDLGTLDGTVSGISSEIGNTALPTTAQTLTGAIAELDNGKVSKAGDTMTGALTFTPMDFPLDLKANANWNDKPNSAATTYLRFRDKASVSFAFLAGLISKIAKNGTDHARTMVRMYTTCNSHNNILTLSVDDDGTNSVAVTDPSAWRYAIGLGTSGALPITVAQGGSGQTAVTSVTTASSIVTAASGFTVASASYYQWGKIVQIRMQFKKTAAQSTAAEMTLGTIVSGKRPIQTCATTCNSGTINTVTIGSNGNVIANGTWAANAEKGFFATYILP